MTDSINVDVHLIEITISFSGGFADPTPRFGNNLHLDVVLVGLKRGVKNCEWKKEVGEGIYIYMYRVHVRMRTEGLEKRMEEREKEERMIGLFCAKIGVCWRK